MTISRPAETEYNDFFKGYVSIVPQEDLISALQQSGGEVAKVFRSIPPEIEVFRYDTNKWSIKEVLMHLVDYERYFSFKALVSLRNDTDTVLYHPKREHYLFNAGTEKRHLADLVPEFEITRAATISLFEHAAIPQLKNTGHHANDVHAISVRALGFAMAGHCMHHVKIIQERYMKAF